MTEADTEIPAVPAKLPKINPFLIPGWEHAPKTALCPWRWKSHAGFYIDVDNYAQSLSSFQGQFTNPALLEDMSRLVLVAGDSGCGKSALRNHCVHLLAKALDDQKLRAEIVDLTQEVDRAPGHEMIIDIKKRMSSTGEQLVDQLARSNLVDEASQERLRGLADRPRRLYSALPEALDRQRNSDVVLFLLLPTVEMVSEVEEYAAMPGRRIVYFVESLLVRSKVEQIAHSQGADVPPVTMTVGVLNPGDARRFVDARFAEGRKRGEFPGLHDDVVKEFGSRKEMSIAHLQSILARIYKQAMANDDKYVNGQTISLQEAQKLIFDATLEERSLR